MLACRKQAWRFCALVAVSCAVFPVSGAFLSPADRDTIQQQQRDLLQQNQQQRQQLQRSISPTRPEAPPVATDGGPCFTINTVRLEGAPHLPASAQQTLTHSYLQRCLILAQIQTPLKPVSVCYTAR